MKRKMKRLLFAMSILIGGILFSGCAGQTTAQTEAPTVTLTEQEVDDYKMSTRKTIQSLAGLSEVEMEEYSKVGQPFVIDAIIQWREAKKELGAFKEIKKQTVETEGDLVTITSEVEYEKKNATVILTADKIKGALSIRYEVQYGLAAMLQRVGLNTALGLGIVFIMLIFLTFLISLFKHVQKLEAIFDGKAKVTVPEACPEQGTGTDNLLDYAELTAVIAAAIAASQQIPTDSFVVRTIKKANTSKWKKS